MTASTIASDASAFGMIRDRERQRAEPSRTGAEYDERAYECDSCWNVSSRRCLQITLRALPLTPRDTRGLGAITDMESSGKKGANPETSWTMAKTGNAYLRAATYRMAVVGVQHNPIIRAHYARKRAAGKSAMNSLGHCMSKA
jgi:hypothetical protein